MASRTKVHQSAEREGQSSTGQVCMKENSPLSTSIMVASHLQVLILK